MINYYELGPDKCLNEVVMAGSHDAGITSGGSNSQTQSVDIHGQATAGVRIFDLRIPAATVAETTGGTKNAELKSFHADSRFQSPSWWMHSAITCTYRSWLTSDACRWAVRNSACSFFRTIVFCDGQRHETSIVGDTSSYLIEFEQLLS